jgi:hypothetical protein
METSSLQKNRPHLEAVLGPLSSEDDAKIRGIFAEADMLLLEISHHFHHDRAGWEGTGLELAWAASGQVSISSNVSARVEDGKCVDFCVELRPSWYYGDRSPSLMWEVETEIYADCQHAVDHGSMDLVHRIEPLLVESPTMYGACTSTGGLAVGRLGARSDADLAWENKLLQQLDHKGLTVPVPIPTADGRLFADGLVVMTYVVGGPPETEADWRRVADMLRQLHRLTRGWPQRPGWRSSTDLLHAETGTKIELGAMPAESVARCRAAWARLTGRETCVDHGNPNNPGNIRITANRVALLDWDEAHTDVPYVQVRPIYLLPDLPN